MTALTPGSIRIPPPFPSLLASPTPLTIVNPEILVWFGYPDKTTAVVLPLASMNDFVGPSPAII